jgi:3-oxoacyl-[acyl-carrier-protein] synthase II
MKLAIQGVGWVTPLGQNVPIVWKELLRGGEATVGTISSELNPQVYPAFRIAESKASHPRLRRASAISRFAVEAGLAALQDAGLNLPDTANRMALVFATANGGVIYTKRFYHDIVATGAEAASPLLFPETVFNAPASHLAAVIGITGATYTLVGDSAVGLLALKMAEDLMRDETLDYCLVVAAEEVDWLLCDAYHRWRLLRNKPPLEVFRTRPQGTILSEGAGAILLGREGALQLDQINAGSNFAQQKEVPAIMKQVLIELAEEKAGILIGSANGTFIDRAEMAAFASTCGERAHYTLKPALGEALAAGAIWQVIAAAQALRTRQLPPLLHAGQKNALSSAGSETNEQALVLVCGLNQQIAGARLNLS